MVYMRTDVLSKLAVHYENSAQCYCFKANIIISSNSDYFSPQYSWKSCRFRGKKTPPPVFFLLYVFDKDIYILIHIRVYTLYRNVIDTLYKKKKDIHICLLNISLLQTNTIIYYNYIFN
jgi:hypothetical protein